MICYALCVVPVPLRKEFLYSFDNEKMNVIEGGRVEVPFAGRNIVSYVVRIVKEKPLDAVYEIKSIRRVIDKEPVFGNAEWRLALWMEYFYFSSRGEVLDTMIPSGKRDTSASLFSGDMDAINGSVKLTDEQKNAISIINGAESGMFYVYGITGSGKTEVFLNCAENVIENGGQVIYLVPEITLTHQLAEQVLKRFKDKVAVLHSALTPSERIMQWKKIKKGELRLIIGARSAVFAPCPDLKMIIIDEEHESSYKSSNNPRYHARQVAQKRITDCAGKLVMGSATPSLEAWNLMKNSKLLKRLDLTHRVGGGKIPLVTVSDMRKERGIIGTELYRKMRKTLSDGHQVILFLNRRGYSYFFHCKSCGFQLKCPDCDVTMTYHKKTGQMVCHYCGHIEKPLDKCPDCGSSDVMYSGFGTEQVQAEVQKLFPEYKTARLDTDVASVNRKNIQLILNEFKDNKIQILLGTQMIAKGLNFPNVRLVGIVLADSTLLMPDFRADERTFSLLVQVAGRSGRTTEDGEVVVQTNMMGVPAIERACNFDCDSFFDNELNIRKETGFPPYSRMVNILFRSKNMEKAEKDAEIFADELKEYSQKNRKFEIFGPEECAIDKLRGYWRYHILCRGFDISAIISSVWSVIDRVKSSSGVIREIDVDPLEML